ncbi:MAG: acetyl-CoA hydrolase/transferase C-terminal domain-containing protein [Pseudomonadales bacterium]|jgi:4-hydroxybutyrate CoA-transferase
MSVPQDFLEPGQRIWVAGSSNEPTAVLEALSSARLPGGLTFIQFPLAGFNRTDFTTLAPDARMETFFMTPVLRDAAADRLDFVPMQMRAVYDHLGERVDVALLQAARDARGRLRLGPNVDFAGAAMAAARTLIVEVNEAITAPAGGLPLDEAAIDCVVPSRRALPEMPPPVIDSAAATIGANVAALIRDGDCIQTGIGSIPAAILKALGDRNDLGLHGGLIDDGGMALIRAGNVTGTRKGVDKGLAVTGMALGSTGLYDWLAETPEVVFRGANHTHEVAVIRELDNFVSINSAVEVDLYGQVNAEVAGGRQISGTGGSVDFMRAARASRGGRSIIAMNATARGGTVSRIVPRVELVTALRTDVDLVVTEHGVASLKGQSVAERARRLIAIAAPEFRDGLSDLAPR